MERGNIVNLALRTRQLIPAEAFLNQESESKKARAVAAQIPHEFRLGMFFYCPSQPRCSVEAEVRTAPAQLLRFPYPQEATTGARLGSLVERSSEAQG